MNVIFDGWAGIYRVLVVGPLAYVALIILLRASGKRTLSKFNAFDFVVTVALGSTLATILLSKDVPLADGVAALALLIALQYGITWLSVRWEEANSLVKSEPSLLVRKGEFLDRNLKRQRVARDEVMAALRSAGLSEVRQADAVILETDGSMSVIPV